MISKGSAFFRLFIEIYRKYGLEKFLIYVFGNQRWPKWLFFYTRHTLLACSEVKLSDSMKRRLSSNKVKVEESVLEDYGVIARFWCHEHNCDRSHKQENLKKEHESGMRIFFFRSGKEVHGFIQVFRYLRIIPFLPGKGAVYISSNDEIGLFGYGLIAPEWRMKGLFLQLMNEVFRQNPNKVFFVTDISPLNRHSINSHRRIGFDEFIQVRYFLFFNILPVWCVRTKFEYKWFFCKNLELSPGMIKKAYAQLHKL